MATISGGAPILDFMTAVEEGMGISVSGLEKSTVREAAWAVVGVRARRLRGRWERGSAEVGTDSGMGSDILKGDLSLITNKGWSQIVIMLRGRVVRVSHAWTSAGPKIGRRDEGRSVLFLLSSQNALYLKSTLVVSVML